MLAQLTSQWEPVCAVPPSDVMAPGDWTPAWDAQFDVLRETTNRLKWQGRWAEGPHDLLSIVGLNRWELAHSAALAWLCNPYAGHGLGHDFLASLVARTGAPVPLDGVVIADTEVSRAQSRADVVVRGEGWTLVIEVKVDASEQDLQAQRLFDDWSGDGDVRFIFLTRRGLPPESAADAWTTGQWTPLAWRELLRILEALKPRDRSPALSALTEYQRTVRATFG